MSNEFSLWDECAIDYQSFEKDIFSCTQMQGHCGYLNFETARSDSIIMRGCLPCYTREEESECQNIIGCKWDKSGEMCHKGNYEIMSKTNVINLRFFEM